LRGLVRSEARARRLPSRAAAVVVTSPDPTEILADAVDGTDAVVFVHDSQGSIAQP
jgi:propanediol dehydratase large subunit